jgi:hypothetical protein
MVAGEEPAATRSANRGKGGNTQGEQARRPPPQRVSRGRPQGVPKRRQNRSSRAPRPPAGVMWSIYSNHRCSLARRGAGAGSPQAGRTSWTWRSHPFHGRRARSPPLRTRGALVPGVRVVLAQRAPRHAASAVGEVGVVRALLARAQLPAGAGARGEAGEGQSARRGATCSAGLRLPRCVRGCQRPHVLVRAAARPPPPLEPAEAAAAGPRGAGARGGRGAAGRPRPRQRPASPLCVLQLALQADHGAAREPELAPGNWKGGGGGDGPGRQ